MVAPNAGEIIQESMLVNTNGMKTENLMNNIVLLPHGNVRL